MALDRTRYSHPDPAQIGQPFIGDLGTAPAGRPFTQEYTGTLGPSMRAVVPVFADGRARRPRSSRWSRSASPCSGSRTRSRTGCPPSRWPPRSVLGTGLLGAWLISRRLRRQTHGLGEGEITRMYEYYDAVLHAVREGLLLVDTEARVQLLNDEAKRLLDLDDAAVGRPVADLGFPDSLTRAVLATDSRPDEIHLVDDAVLVVNTAPARWQGREVGTVVTLRDHTEIQAVAGELDTVRGLAESLRSQNHEAANRLHTVVSLVELGRTEEALDFATEELEIAQLLTDRVVGSVSDPVVSALLLGKTAQAAERGVQLRIDDRTDLSGAADRAARRGDDPGQPGRQRPRRGRASGPSGSSWSSCRARRPGSRSGSSDSGAGVPAGLDELVFRARLVDEDLRRPGRPRARAGAGGPGRPQVRRAHRRDHLRAGRRLVPASRSGDPA